MLLHNKTLYSVTLTQLHKYMLLHNKKLYSVTLTQLHKYMLLHNKNINLVVKGIAVHLILRLQSN